MNLCPWFEASILIYCGKTGSGKSYNAVRQIRQWVKDGGMVLTNIIILQHQGKVEQVRIITNEEILAFDFQGFAVEYGKPILVVIDECQLLFQASDWQKFPKSFLALLTQHRHLQMTVIAICQTPEQIDRNFRYLASAVVDHWNIARYGLQALVLSILTRNLHLARSREVLSKTKLGSVSSRSLFRIRKTIRESYRTVQLLHSDQKPVDPPGNPYRKWFFGCIFLTAFLVLGRYRTEPTVDAKVLSIAQELSNIPAPRVKVDVKHVLERRGLLDVVGTTEDGRTAVARFPVKSVAGTSVGLAVVDWPLELWGFPESGVAVEMPDLATSP
jgi:hypothetical protein